MGNGLKAALIAVAVMSSGPGDAAELSVDAARRSALTLTIYGNGLALVKDRRSVVPANEFNRLVVDGVSPMLLADSLRVGLDGDGRIVEQAFEPAKLTPLALLEAHIGRPARLIRTDPKTGLRTEVEATPISVRGGVIARIGGRVISNPEGRWSFESVPAGLRDHAVVALGIDGVAAGAHSMELRYLTSGLSWRAAYTADWDRDAGQVSVDAWAYIDNAAGIDFNDARVQLVAGSVNRISQPSPQPRPRGAVMMKAEAAMDSGRTPQRESLDGFHMYSLPAALTLPNGGGKLAALLSSQKLAVARELLSRGNPNVFGGGAPRTAKPDHPAIQLRLLNAADGGQPWPGGAFRLYGRDESGEMQFLGEDRIGDVPVGGAATIAAGRAFDLTVARRRTDFRRESRDLTETAFEIEAINGGDADEVVKIIEALPGDWRILDSDKAHVREGDGAVWEVSVPARGKIKFSYRVRVRS